MLSALVGQSDDCKDARWKIKDSSANFPGAYPGTLNNEWLKFRPVLYFFLNGICRKQKRIFGDHKSKYPCSSTISVNKIYNLVYLLWAQYC
jgi:hypothetical protein